tara:strand:- start:119 stop:274 length:156 start_codon:yes stop_codon:yes gene_type:complete
MSMSKEPVKVGFHMAENWVCNYVEHASKAQIAELYKMLQKLNGQDVVVNFD